MKEFTKSFTSLSLLNIGMEREIFLMGDAAISFADMVAHSDGELAAEIREAKFVFGEKTAPPPGCCRGYSAGWYWSW